MAVKHDTKELNEAYANRKPFGTFVKTRVMPQVRVELCQACGYPSPPKGHSCLNPVNTKLWLFCYMDGPYIILKSPYLTRERFIRGEIEGWQGKALTDDELARFMGLDKASDMVAHTPPTRSEETLDMLRAVRNNEDLAPFRELTRSMAKGWRKIANKPFVKWTPMKEVPTVWRRVALGDKTVIVPVKLPPFRGKDTFAFDPTFAKPIVPFSAIRDGRHRKGKMG